MEFKAKTNDFVYEVKDSLDLHNESLNIMFRPGHYDIIYENAYTENNLDINDYDKEMPKVAINPAIEEEKKKVEEIGKDEKCWWCNQGITDKKSRLDNNGPMHKKCYCDLLAILGKEEKKEAKFPHFNQNNTMYIPRNDKQENNMLPLKGKKPIVVKRKSITLSSGDSPNKDFKRDPNPFLDKEQLLNQENEQKANEAPLTEKLIEENKFSLEWSDQELVKIFSASNALSLFVSIIPGTFIDPTCSFCLEKIKRRN